MSIAVQLFRLTKYSCNGSYWKTKQQQKWIEQMHKNQYLLHHITFSQLTLSFSISVLFTFSLIRYEWIKMKITTDT